MRTVVLYTKQAGIESRQRVHDTHATEILLDCEIHKTVFWLARVFETIALCWNIKIAMSKKISSVIHRSITKKEPRSNIYKWLKRLIFRDIRKHPHLTRSHVSKLLTENISFHSCSKSRVEGQSRVFININVGTNCRSNK